MQAEEIICLAILPEDVAAGVDYAYRSLHFTFDRMGYGGDLVRRLGKIALGKSCEATLLRFLRQHGIPHISREGATPHTQPDRFDVRVLNEIVDLKTFHVPDAVARPDKIVHCLALIPCHQQNDQWSKRRRFDRQLFGFFKGNFRYKLRSDQLQTARHAKPRGKRKMPAREAIEVMSAPSILFMAAAPSIVECEARFVLIKAGTRCMQYPHGTRIDNMGCEISRLTSFRDFMDTMDKYRRRPK